MFRIGARACAWLSVFAWFLGCTVSPTPTVVSQPIVSPSVAPTRVPFPLPTTIPNTSTPILEITLITPTPAPTLPTRAALNPTTVISVTTRVATPRASEFGNSVADQALRAVLDRCWQLADPRQLDGNNPAQRAAFDCARPLLLEILKNYPTYAPVHYVLAWGYLFQDKDTPSAISEYRAAANLFQQEGNASAESQTRLRVAALLFAINPAQSCAELAQASAADATNTQALEYSTAFKCSSIANQTGNAPPVDVPPFAHVDVAQLRGTIVFKSDRIGFPAYYAMDEDGKNVKQIPRHAYDAAAKWEAWSPDRTQAATVRNAGFTKKFGYDNDIWITDPSGNGRPLTNPADDYDPAWSPVPLFDGRTWIAFVSNRGDLAHPEQQGEDLWVMHDDGSSPFRVSCNAPSYSKHPSWSPDASKIVFHSNQQAEHAQIFVMDVSALGTLNDYCQLGQNPLNLSRSASNDTEPVWVK